MARTLVPQHFELVGCTRGCSLNPDSLPDGIGAAVHSWFEAGNNNPEISRKSDAVGHHLSQGAIGRHRKKHLVIRNPKILRNVAGPPRSSGKTDLQILDQIIGRGADMVDLSSFRITAEQLLRAIELKQKLTQGSLFADFFGAIEEESDRIAHEAALLEEPDAMASEDEQEQAIAVGS